MNNKVSIATKPLVYSAFRYLNHKAWNALAEYVDNSLQSYMDHKELLQRINPNGKLTVKINIDVTEGRIEVIDNAFGIEENNFERAFELANIPLDASGLNEFGMGMKVSSIWFSDWWTLETSAYGDTCKKKVIFDLNDVSQNERLMLDVDVKPAKAEEHYTKLTLLKLAAINKPAGRTITAIKKHLTSIYIKFIREGVLDLYVNDELLVPSEPKILKAPYHKAPNSKPIEWKYDVNFEAPKFVNGRQEGWYIAKGFIGVLETMSEIESGILLFRRGRVIGSSYDEKYKPKLLSGNNGSPRSKRIFGELELDGFNVSFNKSAFVEDEDFYTFIEMLKEDITSHKTLDIFGQAENYRKPASAADKKKIASNISSALNKTPVITITEQDINTASTVQQPASTSQTQHVDTTTEAVVTVEKICDTEEQTTSDVVPTNTTPKVGFDDITRQLDLLGKHYTLVIGSNFDLPDGIYSFRSIGENTFRSDLNLENPFFERFNKTFSSGEGVDSVLSFITTMLTTEISLMEQKDYKSGKSFRDLFNQYFGKL